MKELSMQLYSARNIELNESLKAIADAGYSSVEAYNENFKDVATFQDGLKAHGLNLVSAHVPLNELENNIDASMELLRSFGCSHAVCPYLLPEDRPSDKAGWLALANKLDTYTATLNANNFTFAWHNHDFEFEKLDDGSIPMQLLLDAAPNMQWEADIGWIAKAGLEPGSWLKDNAKRISAIHLKDVAATGECADEDGWADVGYGIIDWSGLIDDIKQTSAKHFIVEHDNPADFQRFAKKSFESIKDWKW